MSTNYNHSISAPMWNANTILKFTGCRCSNQDFQYDTVNVNGSNTDGSFNVADFNLFIFLFVFFLVPRK